ncbi:MAG: DUF5924 family protein [Nannocystaceae bacterium]|nr:DUF2914 domain-containing protein [bacterium]
MNGPEPHDARASAAGLPSVPPEPILSQPEPPPEPPAVKTLLEKWGPMLWWLHSIYALGLGIGVLTFASKGFGHARWLAVSLGSMWIILLVFFRWFGGRRRAPSGRNEKIRFYVMTYMLKNLYQGMLFFLLPFYWRSAVYGAPSQWFVVVLGACALLSTLDVVFDQVLMRFKVAASVFYFLTLFCCLNLVIPALFPNTRSLVTLVAAAIVSALAFWTMHIPIRFHGRPAVVALLVIWSAGSLAGAYFGRAYVPPVAMHVASGAVGPDLLEDGRLEVEATRMHRSLVEGTLHAVTNVSIPGGRGDTLTHVWRKDGEVIHRFDKVRVDIAEGKGQVRLTSSLEPEHCPDDRVGQWWVDVETADGQVVGRVSFEVTR